MFHHFRVESFKPEDIIGKKSNCFGELSSKKPSWRRKSRNDFDVQYRKKVGFVNPDAEGVANGRPSIK
jgi:hypothetical protein